MFDRASHTIFTISNNVATIQKLLALFGTTKDTSDMRSRLHSLTENTRDMVRQTGSDLKSLLARSKTSSSSSSSGSNTGQLGDRHRKMAQQKLQKDFEAVLKRFQSVSQLAAEKSREYVALARAAHVDDPNNEDDDDDAVESQPLMSRNQRMHLQQVDTDIEFNEALISEREEDLREIEKSIVEVNEIFRDLGTLVHEQQYMLDNIESNVQSVEINMENA
ncbi:t-SNARE, partial [Phlyctochytrium arcticum]